MSEFSIIADYFSKQHTKNSAVVLSIGDDAALVNPDKESLLAVSVDTLVSGVHFPQDTSAYDIGWKSLAVNLSDMAAMSAKPCWATLAITLPEENPRWLEKFAQGFFDIASQYNVDLIGGDTTRGPLSITVNIAGEYSRANKSLRSSAEVADNIYVTGIIGDAALGLISLQQDMPLSTDEKLQLQLRLNRPIPRVKESLALAPYINAAIDISDGLYADLGHILKASKVGAELNVNSLPVSRLYRWFCQGEHSFDLALTGGDDYELCLTVAAKNEQRFLNCAEQLNLKVTKIGMITSGNSLTLYNNKKEMYSLSQSGYDHFAIK